MNEEPTASESQTYYGNCHCGAYKFSIKSKDGQLTQAFECNCSICTRNGALWIVGMADGSMIVEKGEGSLREYVLNPQKGHITLLFCPKCGTAVMEKVVRVLRGLDVEKLKMIYYDGAANLPPYKAPSVPDHHKKLKARDRFKLYHGNCNCGAVVYSVMTKPLEEVEVVSCNCSLCSRNGDLWIYPSKGDVRVEGENTLTGYEFLHKDSLHAFCSTCGVSVLVKVTEPGTDILPINVRTLNGIDVKNLKLKTYDGWSNDPQYVVD